MRRLILISCWGLILSGAVFDPARSIGEGLLRNPHIEALVTTVRVARIDALDLPHMYYLANLGLSLGEVANRANQFRLARGQSADFICYGDPLSHVRGSVMPADAPRGEDGAYHVAVNNGAVAQDLAVRLKGEVLPEEPVVVVDGDAPAHGVYEPGQAVFFSVPSNAADIRFRVRDRRTLVPVDALRALVDDLTFARGYTRNLAWMTQAGDGSDIVEAIEAIEIARDAMETCPLLGVGLGAVVHSGFVDEGLQDLEDHLAACGRGMMAAFVEGTRRMSSVHPGPTWQSRSRFIVDRRIDPCPYCGTSCDEFCLESRLGGSQRSSLNCHACGFIFDGDPALGIAMVSPASLEERRIHVELPVKNPYSMTVPACGVLVFEPFKRGDITVSEICAMRVPSGGAGSLPVELTAPGSLIPGVYYLAGALMVGARMQFFRRPFHVKPARAPVADA